MPDPWQRWKPLSKRVRVRADARLMTLVSESGTSAIARALLSGSYDEQLSDPSLLDVARTFFAQATGVTANAAERSSPSL